MNSPFPVNKDDTAGSEETRKRERDSLFLKAEMRLPEQGAHFEARIRNLSSGGLMAEGPASASRGEPVEVNLRNLGWVFGSVAWATESRFGVAFNAPIDPKLVRKQVGGNNESISLMTRFDRQTNYQQRR